MMKRKKERREKERGLERAENEKEGSIHDRTARKKMGREIQGERYVKLIAFFQMELSLRSHPGWVFLSMQPPKG